MFPSLRRFALASAVILPNAAAAEVIIPPTDDALLANLAIPADAPTMGMWSPVGNWPVIGLHAAVLPSGAVMSYGTAIGNGAQDGRTFDIWTPEAGLTAGSHYTFVNAEQVDSFCSTSTYLTTGAMLISGGKGAVSGFSSLASSRFDSGRYMATAVASKLTYARWYASMLTLPDGRALILGGVKPYQTGVYADAANADVDGRVSNTPEIYSEAAGWKTLPGARSTEAFGATNNRWWYPRAWVGSDGLVFGISSDRMWKLDPSGDGSIVWSAPFKSGPNETTRPNIGPTSTAVMYAPGRILQVGGNGIVNGQQTTSSRLATVFAIDGTTPTATDVNPMTYARQWANATVLPNGRVLVTGGTTFGDNAGSDAVYPSETWDPRTGAWSVGAKAAVYRGYHSATVLLPNGTVLSTGGGAPGPSKNFNAEIYYPPYLFRASGSGAVLAQRPVVQSINSLAFRYGAPIVLRSPHASTIVSAALIGLSSTTHGFNTSQRYIPLRTAFAGDQVVTMAPDARLATPGYYQLVLLDRFGVPSRGVVVALGIVAPKPQPPVSSTFPALPTDGSLRTFQSVNYPDRAVRHREYLGWLEPVGPASTALTKADASFAIRPGLADPACYSLEAKNFINHFVRVDGGRIVLTRRPAGADAAFDLSATFCARRGFTGADVSLEAKGKPGWFLRHRNFELWLDRFDGLKLFTADSTFKVIAAY